MRNASLAAELAAIRAELDRLRAREAQLEASLEAADGAVPALRPGWPIRRLVVSNSVSFH
jgi:HD superfamily phosphodiesterase